MNEFFGWFAAAWAVVGGFIDDYSDQVVIGAGSVGMLFALVAIRKFVKNNEHDEVAANLGVFLFLVVTTEGMWEVVRHKLGVDPWLAVSMFAAFDVVIYAQGKSAIRKLIANNEARIGHHLAIIWALSVAASVTVSFASGNAATWSFRFFAPLVGAALWTQKVLELRKRDGARQESNWIWTPTRLMVRWGWMKPGAADDLTEVLRKRTVEQIVNAAVLVWLARPVDGVTPDPKLVEKAGKAAQRLQVLAKTADPVTVAAARAQLRIAVKIQDELFDGLDEPSVVTAADADGARTEPVSAMPDIDGDDGDWLDPWLRSVPAVRPSAGSSGPSAATVQDRPRRVVSTELDRVWANLGGGELPQLKQLPSAPSAGSSAHVNSPNRGGDIAPPSDPADDADDLLDDARTVAEDLLRRGFSVSRDNLAKAMRKAGFTVSNDRAGDLVRKLRTADGRADDARTANGRPAYLTGSPR